MNFKGIIQFQFSKLKVKSFCIYNFHKDITYCIYNFCKVINNNCEGEYNFIKVDITLNSNTV